MHTSHTSYSVGCAFDPCPRDGCETVRDSKAILTSSLDSELLGSVHLYCWLPLTLDSSWRWGLAVLGSMPGSEIWVPASGLEVVWGLVFEALLSASRPCLLQIPMSFSLAFG